MFCLVCYQRIFKKDTFFITCIKYCSYYADHACTCTCIIIHAQTYSNKKLQDIPSLLVEAVCLFLLPSSNRANSSLEFEASLMIDPCTYTSPFLSFFISIFSCQNKKRKSATVLKHSVDPIPTDAGIINLTIFKQEFC